MRQRARPHPETDREVLCPFCETSSEVDSKAAWCAGCGAARSVDEAGEVTFDASRKADRQTVDRQTVDRQTVDRQTVDRQTVDEAVPPGGPRAEGLSGAARRRPVRLRKKR